MKEIIYKINKSGLYEASQYTAFYGATQMKLIIEPHSYCLKVGEDVLRETSSAGYSVIVSDLGGARFFDENGNLIARAEDGDKKYKEARFQWKEGFICICFGGMVEVDCYPNCDGEHDRWECRWKTERTVTLSLGDSSVSVE